MFISNDSNYSFGKFLAVVSGDDIKAPVYSKCFTDTEALKGYRFVHDPEETDPEKCVCFSIYNETSSAATATAFKANAVVSDLTAVLFRLDTAITGGVLRNVPYYHVIVPVVNIKDETELKYLVIKMTKEVELFPENYPYYELVSTFADAKPTSAEAPGSVTPTGTIQITENDTYDVTNYASAEVNVPGITPTGTIQITENDTYDVTNYASAEVNVPSDFTTCTMTNLLLTNQPTPSDSSKEYYVTVLDSPSEFDPGTTLNDAVLCPTTYVLFPQGSVNNDTVEKTVVLYKGESYLFDLDGTFEISAISLSGNIQQLGQTPTYKITGDFTVTYDLTK